MLVVVPLNGDWKLWLSPSLSGEATGLWSEAVHWGVLIPPRDAKEHYVEGLLMESNYTNQFGDRTVMHFNLHGRIAIGGEDIISSYTTTVGQPADPRYIGDDVVVDTYEIITSDGTVVHWNGFLSVLDSNWTKLFPNHSYVRKRWNRWVNYQNVSLECRCFNHAYQVTLQYQMSQGQGSQAWTSRKEVVWSGSLPPDAESASDDLPSLVSSIDVTNVPRTFPWHWWTSTYRNLRWRYLNPIIDDQMYGDLVRRSVEDAVCLGRNNISFLTELPLFVDSLKSMASTLNGSVSLKAVSNLYLQYKYGPRLTILDAIDNIKDLKPVSSKKNYNWVRTREVVADSPVLKTVGPRLTSYNYKVYYDQFESGSFAMFSQAWNYGLFPTLQNGWDMIPLSFVVDWFSDISEQLSVYDAQSFWTMHDVLGCCFSKKETYQSVQGVLGYSLHTTIGQIDFSRYIRQISDFVHQPCYLSLDKKTFNNYLEGAALLIGRSKG